MFKVSAGTPLMFLPYTARNKSSIDQNSAQTCVESPDGGSAPCERGYSLLSGKGELLSKNMRSRVGLGSGHHDNHLMLVYVPYPLGCSLLEQLIAQQWPAPGDMSAVKYQTCLI